MRVESLINKYSLKRGITTGLCYVCYIHHEYALGSFWSCIWWVYVVCTIKVLISYSQILDKKWRGGVAQMVERSLSMREVRGSMPLSSNLFFLSFSILKKPYFLLRNRKILFYPPWVDCKSLFVTVKANISNQKLNHFALDRLYSLIRRAAFTRIILCNYNKSILLLCHILFGSAIELSHLPFIGTHLGILFLNCI